MKSTIWSIADAVNRHAREVGGFSELERKVNEVFANKESRRRIDRRKLKAIADGREFTISTGELIAIDNYFSPLGIGFGDEPLFAKENALKSLARNGNLCVTIGAFQRNEEERNDVSLWDVKAFQEVRTAARKIRGDMPFTLHDVPFFDENGRHNHGDRSVPQLLSESRSSVCSIGSPRANVASEVILADMFGLKPFRLPSAAPPFRFYWCADAERTKRGFSSAFDVSLAEIERLDPKFALQARKKKRLSALVVGDTVHTVVPKIHGNWSDYGIVAAQKCAEDRVRVVIAGLTGPSTLACAKACTTRLSLPTRPGEDSCKVFWIVVRASVSQRKTGVGDLRELQDSIEVVDGPYPRSPGATLDQISVLADGSQPRTR